MTTSFDAGMEHPPGGRPAGARPWLRELSPRECWDLIAPGGIGRVAATTDDGPIVLPVNFAVDDDSVVFRSSPYGVIGRLGRAAEVAFEIDRLDETTSTGWSVLLVGCLERVDDPDEASGLWRTRDPDPWAGGVRNLFLRLRPRRVTGRRVETS